VSNEMMASNDWHFSILFFPKINRKMRIAQNLMHTTEDRSYNVPMYKNDSERDGQKTRLC